MCEGGQWSCHFIRGDLDQCIESGAGMHCADKEMRRMSTARQHEGVKRGVPAPRAPCPLTSLSLPALIRSRACSSSPVVYFSLPHTSFLQFLADSLVSIHLPPWLCYQPSFLVFAQPTSFIPIYSSITFTDSAWEEQLCFHLETWFLQSCFFPGCPG